MIYQQIRNATVRITYAGKTFLVDPWLQDAGKGASFEIAKKQHMFVPAPVVELPKSPQQVLTGVDLTLVTHLHSDHFTGDYLPADLLIVLQNKADCVRARHMGFKNTRCFDNDEWSVGDVRIHRVDGKHGDSDIVAAKCGTVSGYVFSAENEPVVYLAGDTVFYDGVAETVRKWKPHVIIVNSCDARMPDGRLIMDADDVEQVCRISGNAVIIASHMETVTHAFLTRRQLAERMEEAGFAERVLIPADGEIINL